MTPAFRERENSPLMSRETGLAYGTALLCVGAAALARAGLEPLLGAQAPYFTFVLAVMVAAWRAGSGPAVLAAVLGWLIGAIWFVSPRGAFDFDGANWISGVAYLLYYRLIADVGPTRAMTVTFLMPAFGMAWGVLFLDERVTVAMVAGAAMVVVGTAAVVGFAVRRRAEA